MRQLLPALASLRLSMAGFALLAAGTVASYNLEPAPPGLIVGPLALLALNLGAAIALRPALRRGGLGLFHLALLALLLLAGAGRLLHFDGRVEVTEGTGYDAAQVEVMGSGRFNGGGWRGVAFGQGAWDVDYVPGMRRAHTRSQVWLPGEDQPQVIGDDTPLVLDGYRFYTTHNKGFAPLLTWQPAGGEPVQGVLHLPSYPLFDWKQENRWTAPDGREFRFLLRIERPLSDQVAWRLDPHDMPAVLVVEAAGLHAELRPGDTMALAGATLRYERLLGWMGYRIFYDPTLLPLLVAALAGIAGLGWHLWGRTGLAFKLQEQAA